MLAGAFGGAVTTFMPAGTDFPWPAPFKKLVEGVLLSLTANLMRNTVLGSIASFLVWALADPNQSFGGGAANVGQVASGIIVGGAGGSIINNLFRQAQQTEASSSVIKTLTDLLGPVIEDDDGSEDQEEGQEGAPGTG